jgi:hypothetical protein
VPSTYLPVTTLCAFFTSGHKKWYNVLAPVIVAPVGPRVAGCEVTFAELIGVGSDGARLSFVGSLETPALAASMCSKLISSIRFQKATGSAAEHSDRNELFLRKFCS